MKRLSSSGYFKNALFLKDWPGTRDMKISNFND
jgi:hypothetical protein